MPTCVDFNVREVRANAGDMLRDAKPCNPANVPDSPFHGGNTGSNSIGDAKPDNELFYCSSTNGSSDSCKSHFCFSYISRPLYGRSPIGAVAAIERSDYE